jgi:small-conductance mechanosensitive channel
MTSPARLSVPIACGESQQRALRVVTLTGAALLFAAMASGQPVTSTSIPPAAAPFLADVVRAATIDAPPATLSISNREITVFRATVALRTPAVRAAGAERLLDDLLVSLPPGPVRTRSLGGAHVISVGSRDVFAITPADLDPAGSETVDEAAAGAVGRLQRALDEVVEARTPRQMAWSVVLALLATIALVVLLQLLIRGHILLAGLVSRTADRQIARVPGAEVMRVTRFPQLLQYGVGVITAGVAVFLLYGWLTFVLRRFPYSRPWGEALRGFLLERLAQFGTNVLAAIPDLFSVALIVLLTRMLIKAAELVFNAVEEGRATIPGIYPETAQPTRRLVSVVLWLFALALAYPYLPGSDTDAFKGVSVFIGLMISLGSSGIVNQIMSGLTLTYSRALRLGDFVRIGDLEGTVTHLGHLSTKLKAPYREEVTIPNSVVVSAQTTNFSRFADGEEVFTPTAVTIGYDTPWRQVEALLLMAAARTDGVRSTPPPAVRQTGLRDFYVEYTLLVCLTDPAQRIPIFDRLHGNIQDTFNEHGVQIMSPNYEADPAGPKVVPPDQWFASPAAVAQSDVRSPSRGGARQ